MLKFKTFFLGEAKVSDANFSKSVDIFRRLLEKHLGTTLYRYGGKDGYATIGKYKSILYFYDKKKAISFNYANGEIETISLWTSYKLGRPGDYTINLVGINLVGSAYKLLDIIKTPKNGVYPFFPEVKEDVEVHAEMITEARRIAPVDFLELVVKNSPPGTNVKRIPWQEFANIAAAADVSIPGAVYQCKAGKVGRIAMFDLTKLGSLGGSKAADIQPASIQVTPYKDGNFTGDNKQAEKMATQVNTALKNPDIKAEMKDPTTLFGHMASLVSVLARGKIKALLIYGGPGIGKTYVVNQTLEKEGLTKGNGYVVIKGRVTTATLYQILYLHREGGIVMFDDADSIWKDHEAANILKAALDSYDERVISWYSGRTVNISKMPKDAREDFYTELDRRIEDDPADPKIKYPSEFEYKGRICFISNLSVHQFDDAVLNRSVKIDMTLTQDQLFQRMEGILDKMGDPSVPKDAKREIIDFLKTSIASGVMSSASMRTYIAAESLYSSGLPNWRELIDYV